MVFLKFFYRVAAFEIRGFEIFWKISFNRAFGIHKNNLDRKGLVE